MDFEWNPDKAQRNLIKHGVSFDEASTLFNDINLIIEEDVEHSLGEARFRALGVSSQGRVLVVIYNPRRETIRIISARKAEPKEVRYYESNSID